jgi:hypothetical protein
MQNIDTIVQSVSVDVRQNGDQIVNLELRYTGTEDLDGAIVQDEELSIEIPSHAPPPAPKQ